MTLIRIVAATFLFGAPAALAQSAAPPSKIANHANGLSYQPTLGGVAAREQSAGIEQSRAQRSREDKELDQLNRQLLGDKATPPVPVPAR